MYLISCKGYKFFNFSQRNCIEAFAKIGKHISSNFSKNKPKQSSNDPQKCPNWLMKCDFCKTTEIIGTLFGVNLAKCWRDCVIILAQFSYSSSQNCARFRTTKFTKRICTGEFIENANCVRFFFIFYFERPLKFKYCWINDNFFQLMNIQVALTQTRLIGDDW